MYEQRRFNVPYFNGSISDMPNVFRLEINVAFNAELEVKDRREANRRLQAQFLQQKAKSIT